MIETASAERPITCVPHRAANALGIDVAHFDGRIDWAQVLRGGMSFAFVKATDGTEFVDPLFAFNWRRMGEVGITRGAYHFFRASEDALAQARQFLRQAPLIASDLPPVLDLESADGATRSQLVVGAHRWLELVEQVTGKTAILYTGPSFAAEYLDASFGRYPLWVAHYTRAAEPILPVGWQTWTFWQYASAESGLVHVPGMQAAVDANRFNGTHAELVARFCTGPGEHSDAAASDWSI